MYKYYLMSSTGFILLNLSMVVCVKVHKYPPVLWKEKTNRMIKWLVLRLQFVESLIQKHQTLQQSMEKAYCILLTDRYNWILSFIAAHMQVFLKQNLISKYDVSKRKVYIFQELKVHSFIFRGLETKFLHPLILQICFAFWAMSLTCFELLLNYLSCSCGTRHRYQRAIAINEGFILWMSVSSLVLSVVSILWNNWNKKLTTTLQYKCKGQHSEKGKYCLSYSENSFDLANIPGVSWESQGVSRPHPGDNWCNKWLLSMQMPSVTPKCLLIVFLI